ncbi:hypothetical protein E2C01_006019 [Portunus trituberculatus]|uniref:Uncharacterized protein n=1 Tax=Portunus trituberculatus TaxID=210409 RepID=A0A5B7CV30_PORTR|nr:hypothetical protein [Portunus trituberculatus]
MRSNGVVRACIKAQHFPLAHLPSSSDFLEGPEERWVVGEDEVSLVLHCLIHHLLTQVIGQQHSFDLSATTSLYGCTRRPTLSQDSARDGAAKRFRTATISLSSMLQDKPTQQHTHQK